MCVETFLDLWEEFELNGVEEFVCVVDCAYVYVCEGWLLHCGGEMREMEGSEWGYKWRG